MESERKTKPLKGPQRGFKGPRRKSRNHTRSTAKRETEKRRGTKEKKVALMIRVGDMECM